MYMYVCIYIYVYMYIYIYVSYQFIPSVCLKEINSCYAENALTNN